MRRGWGIAASLGICLSWAGAGASDKDCYQTLKPEKKKSSWSSWTVFGSKKDDSREADKARTVGVDKKLTKPPVESPEPRRSPAQETTQGLKEQQKVLRRQQVCDRLREAAAEIGDSSLDAQAQLLEQRAWFIYEQRTGSARLPGLMPAEETVTAARLMHEVPAVSRQSVDRPVRSVMARNQDSGQEE